MQLFVDTANLDEIREGVELGLVDGVTTNPSLFAKERGSGGGDAKREYSERLAEICRIGSGPISAETVGETAEEMVSGDGMGVVREIATIYDNYAFETRILVASARHPRHVLEAALIGADVTTAPLKVLKQLYDHPLTEKGITAFLRDWKGR